MVIYEGSALKHLARIGPDGGSRSAPRPSNAHRDTRADGGSDAGPDASTAGGSTGTAAGSDAAPAVTCGFCGNDFVEDRTQMACQACPLHKKGCALMRCPHCGYENVKAPNWLARIKEWIG